MGLGAAMTFPATLSLLSNVFTDRTERARAIGLWDAIAGVAIATGPIVGAGCWSTSPDSRQFTCTFPIPQASSGLTATQGRDPEPSEWQTFGTIDWAAAGHFTRLLARQVLTDGMPAVVPVLNLNVPRGATTHTEPQDDAEPAPLTVTPSSATRWRRLSR
jgi:MFS family permease